MLGFEPRQSECRFPTIFPRGTRNIPFCRIPRSTPVRTALAPRSQAPAAERPRRAKCRTALPANSQKHGSYTHFTDGKTEAQRGQETGGRSHDPQGQSWDLTGNLTPPQPPPGLMGSRPTGCTYHSLRNCKPNPKQKSIKGRLGGTAG